MTNGERAILLDIARWFKKAISKLEDLALEEVTGASEVSKRMAEQPTEQEVAANIKPVISLRE